MNLTAEHVVQISMDEQLSLFYAEQVSDAFNNAFMRMGQYMSTSDKVMLISQCNWETGGFQWMEELASGEDYEGRLDLGNEREGDGKKFKGRGYIQLTGRANYRKYGKLVGVDIEFDPAMAALPDVAGLLAVAYWNDKNLSNAMREGRHSLVTRKISGSEGTHQRRMALFDKAVNVLTSG